MNFKEYQFEMRSAFLGGFGGQLVSRIIWLVAAAISLLTKPTIGMAALFFGSMFIFPLTQMVVRLIGRQDKVSKQNGLWMLGSQTAFTVPINFPLVGAPTLYKTEWFFPAAMIVVGSHYLPFITLYGMKLFGVLAVILVMSDAGLGLYGPPIFSLGGWFTGVVLIVFALWGRATVLKERKSGTHPTKDFN